jgi:hypothetical protein
VAWVDLKWTNAQNTNLMIIVDKSINTRPLYLLARDAAHYRAMAIDYKRLGRQDLAQVADYNLVKTNEAIHARRIQLKRKGNRSASPRR